MYNLVLKSMILCHFNIRTDFLINKYILDFAINS